jgi:hypothetical protein
MSDVMELEARLKNLISSEMQNIIKSIEDVTKKNTESSKKQKKDNDVITQSVSELEKSWNIAKIAATSFVSALGAMAILNRVSSWMKQARQEAKDNLQVNLQLTSSLGFASAALEKQQDILGKKLLIDDAIIGRIQTSISYFTKDEDQIKRLTKATLDFSAATGMDATSASMLLGRSIENGGIMLSRYGLKIKETNDVHERAEFIIDAVNKKFKDQAEMVAMSKDGWDRLGVTMGDVLQTMGQKIFNPWSNFEGDTQNEKMKKYFQSILDNQNEYDNKRVNQAKLFLANYVSEEEGKRRGLEQFKKDQNDREIEETKKIVNEVMQLTTEGKIRLLEIEREKRLKDVSNTEEGSRQKVEIEKLYNLKISELQNQLANESINLQKKVADNANSLLNQINRIHDQEVQNSIESLKLIYEASEADIKANNDQAERTSNNMYVIMQRKFKASEQDKKDKDDQKKKDDELRKNKIENIQFGEEAVFSSLKNIARATKANSGVQKTLDIAQATASTALAVTKAMAPGLKWQIPFIIAMGATQIALIASQKYQYGGVVPGNKTSGDQVPAMMNSGEMVLTLGQQGNLFNLLSRPNQISNSTSNQNSTNNNSAINLHINVGNNGNYDMNAARYTVDSLVPLLGDALVKAKNEGRLRSYESAR